MEKDYCYIDDALGKKFEPNNYKSGIPYAKSKDFYKDADMCSKKLYEDLLKVYEKIGVLKCERSKYKLKYGDNILLSSDYIGPSRYWASKYKEISDIEIGEYLKKTRILGGHILWPIFKNGINFSRGGSKGYYDRIDCTLYELKLWYLNKDREHKLKKAFDLSTNWLKNDVISSFEDFIDTFHLNMYVDSNYNVYDLTTYDGKNMDLLGENALLYPYISNQTKYKNYIKASIKLIDKRTEEMINS